MFKATMPYMKELTGIRRGHVLLTAAGASMLFTQYVAAREIGSSFLPTEVVLVLCTLVTLAGPSIAYAVSHRIPSRVLDVWVPCAVAVHLALPVGVRALVGESSTRHLPLVVPGTIILVVGVLMAGCYAVFLPRQARLPESLPALYRCELLGAALALLALYFSPSFRVSLLVYWATSLLVLHLGVARPWLSLLGVTLAAIMVIAYPRLDRAAARHYYAHYHRRSSPTIVETTISPYQRIDVVDDASGRRSLYLDGVWFFRAGSFDAHNRLLAELPGRLHGARGSALVLGSGSFSSAAHLHRLGYAVTVVELDQAVARIGFDAFAEVHRLTPGDVDLRITDGRRFLAETSESFDLIAVDVPAPYQVRTALLHTERFYRLARSRLRPGGIMALSLCGSASADLGRAIAAAASNAFPSVLAVESASTDLAILYGGAPLPFDVQASSAALLEIDAAGGRVYGDAEVRALARGAEPLTESRLVPLLTLSREAAQDWFDAR